MKLIIIICLVILTVQSYQLTWNIYKKATGLTFMYPSQDVNKQKYMLFDVQNSQIIFNDRQNIIALNSKNISINMRSNDSNVGFDIYGDCNIKIMTNLNINSKQCSPIQLNQQFKQLQIFKNLQKIGYSCQLPLEIIDQSNFRNWDQIISTFNTKIQKFMNVSNIPLKYFDMVKHILIEIYSSIMIENNNGYNYFCLGDGIKCDQKLSLLPINMLGQFNYELGKWLCDNYINNLQHNLYYNQNQMIPIAESIETLMRYYPKNNSKHIGDILITYLNSIILAPVNHIEQQINYRQSRKVHPTLLRMLTIPYKANSLIDESSSNYTESFTEDFYYHGPDRKLQMGLGKYMWIIKLIVMCQYYNSQYQAQLKSLMNIIKTILNQDVSAKSGIYRSIVLDGTLRLYSKDYGYQNLLPYAYAFSDIFPVSIFQNLTTQYGLSSMPIDSPHYQIDRYQFRGNIHLYYNFKFTLEKKYQQQWKIWKIISQKIINNWEKQKEIYTSWSPTGQNKQKHSWLKILAIPFLSIKNQPKFEVKSQVKKQ